ncbi:MAG: hypothetical protein HZB62_08100 [Nitrospirae bacterium]|nr:hypothetical protein [Nitrospirota bacterium]
MENNIMWKDPIVEEVRKAGAELAKKSNYNLQSMLQSLRENEKKSKAIVRPMVKAKLKQAG